MSAADHKSLPVSGIWIKVGINEDHLPERQARLDQIRDAGQIQKVSGRCWSLSAAITFGPG
jgi:hypothetical protein